MSTFEDIYALAATSAKAAAASAKGTLKAAAEHTLQTLNANDDAPTFEASINRAMKALEVAQQALTQASSLAPAGPNRHAQRGELTAVHEQLAALIATIDRQGKGKVKEHMPSPPPPSAPVIDLLGGSAGNGFPDSSKPPAADGFAEFVAAPAADSLGAFAAAPGADGFRAFSSAQSAPDTDDLLGLGGPAANHPTSNSSSGSSLDGLDSLFAADPQPTLDDLMNGMSATDELNMAAPLMPDGMGGGPMEPAKRLKLPPAMQANAPPEPEEPQAAIEKRVEAWQDGKNLQAMLATLHEVIPKCCRWEPRSLGALLDDGALKDAYKLALIAIHTDKLVDRPEWERARCQLIFNCLRRNRPRAATAA